MKSIIENLKSIFSGGPSPEVGTRSERRSYVIDPGAGTKGREKLPPGAQVKVLQRLARFAEKESIKLSAVFEGKELRAVKHQGDFQGITVYFVSEPSIFGRIFLEIAKDSAKEAVVTAITNDVELEQSVLSAGCNVMRLSTFEKVFEGGLRRNGTGGSRASRGPRPRRKKPDQQPRMSKQGGSDTDPVRDLLDLVD